jgi:serine/threonine protein kinase
MFRAGFSRCPRDGSELAPLGDDPFVGQPFAGRYVIESFVGQGAMGRVYKARHTRMSRHFAVKVMFGDLAADATMRARFGTEAEAASRLDHPSVINVFDYGTSAEGLVYMVMDFIEGQSLAASIEAGPMPEPRVRRLVRHIIAGLGHAHGRRLVHRDLKADNVIVVPGPGGDEVAKVIDFGIAMMREQDSSAARLTAVGVVIGTPAYMSPEQACGEPIDHRSDLFSLGILVYEMLAGKKPFDGHPFEIARQNVAVTPPAVAERAPGVRVDPLFEAFVFKLMAKAKDDRFQTAEEALAALDHVDRGEAPWLPQHRVAALRGRSGSAVSGPPRRPVTDPRVRTISQVGPAAAPPVSTPPRGATVPSTLPRGGSGVSSPPIAGGVPSSPPRGRAVSGVSSPPGFAPMRSGGAAPAGTAGAPASPAALAVAGMSLGATPSAGPRAGRGTGDLEPRGEARARGPSFAVPPPAPSGPSSLAAAPAPSVASFAAPHPWLTAPHATTSSGAMLPGAGGEETPTLPPEPRLSLPAVEASVGRPLSDTDFNVERTRFPDLKPRRQTWATVALVVFAAVVVGVVLRGSLGGKRALRGRGGADVGSTRGALDVEPVADPELAPPSAPSPVQASAIAAPVPGAAAAPSATPSPDPSVAGPSADPSPAAPTVAGAGAVVSAPPSPVASPSSTRAAKAVARARREAARADARGEVSAESVTATYRELTQAIDAIYHTRGASFAKPFHERLVKTPLNQALADPTRRSRFAAELDRLREDMRRAGVL